MELPNDNLEMLDLKKKQVAQKLLKIQDVEKQELKKQDIEKEKQDVETNVAEVAPRTDLEADTEAESNDELDKKEEQKTLDLFKNLKEELKAKLATYNNPSAAYKSFEKYSTVNRKTLWNFLEKENNRPFPSTIMSFYKWLYKDEKESEISKKLSPEAKWYLANNGYNIETDNQNISEIIFRTNIHFYLYLETEDGQIITKSQVKECYGENGIKILNELLCENIIHAIDEEHCTTGAIRAVWDAEYCRNATMAIGANFPIQDILSKSTTGNGGCFMGNLVIALKDIKTLYKIIQNAEKKILSLHNKGLKEKHQDRETFILSQLLYRTRLPKKEEK